ncbi:30S ribosomal protein S17 [Alkalilimnicola ehrlichii MLHE-1]|uniref:Small ribosomal subunit protein uS17 n=1 Tax=Alkalilimnicola ehrlichii (strain ATCC BAA-1101 / DSM 17681 / MLHE-1) TaxID=187272 RepID=RS17_ALKEH|nr:30S ribosomal protein S17 [Alkalilimnicola ehrlichii]Q0ABG6.1 RecName: Full=Small ribosomal subunit protein uS17; AltName: Full=30S ribosomal protein S17 [Alkalilimnicola ehrlichii MLHE-1]ABI55821.1 SSU ribosomal protein S17P [Alkalilimnicola ehrlichii MLHE-1]
MTENEKVTRNVQGRVVSNKADKTITVLVERRVRHPLYGKYIRRSSKMQAHDEGNECQVGDVVTIEQCRPISKSKAWRLVKVLERAAQ